MAFQTTNVTIGSAWTEIASGVGECMVQLLNSNAVQIVVGSTEPTNPDAGHILANTTRIFRVASLTTEKVYARSSSSSRLAITKG